MEFKQVLSFGRMGTGKIYQVLPAEIKIYMGMHNITNWSQADDTN